jgi:hypothetical protein
MQLWLALIIERNATAIMYLPHQHSRCNHQRESSADKRRQGARNNVVADSKGRRRQEKNA